MKENNSNGKIFFFKTDKSSNPKDNFSQLLEVNSNFDNLKSLYLTTGKAYGITINNELLEWEFEKKKTKKNISSSNPETSENSQNNTQSSFPNKKTDYYFLLSKPSYRFHKMKIKSLALNKTMCLSLDINGNVYVWGQNKDGLLGLGYEVNSVENPTILDGLTEIVDISLSDNHAVALNSSGIPFSWGLGKYGELGLERSIYSPVPQQMNTESIYSRVFCGNLITCFLDFEGHFSYFGVIIKQLGGNSSTVTTKNLLNDQNIDSKSIFLEKEFEELEDQKFKEIVIGNGFIALLGNTGTLFTLEYNDKLTMLYSKYYLYNIVVAKNEIFGLAKDNVKIMENKNDNINENKLINSTNEEKIKTNYYLCRWSSKSSSENEVCSDTWISTIWKFKDEFTNIIENGKLLDTNDNRNILLLLDSDAKYSNNLNTSVLNPNKKLLDLSTTNNELSMLDMTMNNNTTITENIMMFNLNRKKIPEKILEYEAEFDDTFNLKYKRTKAKSKSILKDLPYIGTIRSRSVSRILNKSYNASFQNSAINLNKSNFMNFGNNNISAIGPNTSTFLNKKSILIPTSNNYKKTSGKIFTNNLHNYNNLSNQNNNSKNKNNYFTQNSKSSFSLNNNDISKDNNDIDNNFNISGNNFSASNYKNNQKEKDNDNVNIYDQSIDVKERELNKYRSEIDDIIANYKNKQSIKKNNLLNKYGLSKENNINITTQNRQENYINNQNISRDNFLDINIKDQIENSNNKNNFNDINIENDSPFKMDLNKRYDAENDLNNNIMNISIKDKKNKYDKEKINNNLNLFKRIVQSSEKKNPKKNEIMKNIQYYFKINKVNSKNRNKRKNYKGIRSENEIEFNMNREETFQNVNNNDIKGKSNSFIINNPLNLFISNSDISNIIPTKCLSEGNDILHDDEYSNEDSNNIRREENKYTNNNFEMNQNNNKKEINIIENNNNLDYFDNELISSPAFNNGNMQKNRLSDLIINEANKNKDKNGKNIGFNLQYNNKNKDIKKEKNNNSNNLAIKSTVYTNTNNNTNKNSRFSFGNNSNIKNNVKQNTINNSNINNNKQENSNTNLIIQNINKINLKSDKKENNINAETNKNNINNKEIKDIKQNKVKITKNNNINQKMKSLDSNQPKNNNIKKYIINNKIPKNLNNQQKNIQNNNKETNKNKNQIKNEEENTEKNKNFKKQNMEDYNFDDINGDQKIISKLNNRKQVENNKNNKKVYKQENNNSYEIGENNKKNVHNSNNNYTIDNINNNVNYQNEDIDNNSRINKSSVSYFVYVLTKYLQKKCYLLCAYEIANFQKKYEKNLSLKLLFVVIKKRIIFYKIKFFHRYKKIYKYLVKYKKNNNDISGYNQKKKENKISGNKK